MTALEATTHDTNQGEQNGCMQRLEGYLSRHRLPGRHRLIQSVNQLRIFMISVRTFRIILLILAICMFLGGINVILSRHALPPELLTYKHFAAISHRDSGQLTWVGAISGSIMFGFVVAIIGLYRFWRSARHFFAVLVLVGFISTPIYGPRVQARSVALFDDAINVLQGIVLALLYWSPMREKFIRTPVT